MGQRYPNSVGYSGLTAAEVHQARVTADYRKKVELDRRMREYAIRKGTFYEPRGYVEPRKVRVTEHIVQPSVDILTETRPRNAVMPFGHNAPVSGISHANGAPLTVADFYKSYGSPGGITIEGEYTDVTDRDSNNWKLARWMRRALQALGMFGRVGPWGRILDAWEIGNALAEILQQADGEEAHWDAPAGWTETLRCNPLLAGSALRDVSRAAWVHQCYIGQAVSNTYSTTHRHRILWGQANPAGTLWSVKQSFEWPGALPNNNAAMTFQPQMYPINPSVTDPGVASIDPAYRPGTRPLKTPLSVPYHLRAGRPDNMFFQQGYGTRVQPQAGNRVVIIPPKGPAIVVTRPPAAKPPPANVKERKAKLSKHGVDIMRIVGVTTEALDVLDCLHEALPTKYWAKGVKLDKPSVSPFAKNYFGKGEYRAPSPQEKARAVLDNIDKVDMVKFGTCVLQEQLEDFVIGKTSKKVRENTRRHNPNRPFGWLVGPAL